MSRRSVVIVGASLAGVRAAESLRHEGFSGRIVLVGDEVALPYDRPPLSKAVLEGSRPASSTLLRTESFYVEHEIELVLGTRVVRLLPDRASVELADGRTFVGNRVLLTTGARPRPLDVPGADLAGVHVLRTLDDAAALAGDLHPGARVVVIGAGFIGAEVAATARVLGCEVTMLERDSLPMGRVLGPQLGEYYAALHRAHGVEARYGVGVDVIEGRERVCAVRTADGIRYEADVVVVGVGSLPNVELAADAGLRVANGIVVDEMCRTSNPGVFAAGDVANFWSSVVGGRVRRESWQNAHDQGGAAAVAMLGRPAPYRESPWFWSDQYDHRMHWAGTPAATDELVWRGSVEDDGFCVFFRRDGVLTGAVGINRPKDVRAALALIVTHREVAADLLADPGVDLRKALR